MWTCPKCGRKFKTLDQAHSCAVYDEAHHFSNKSSQIKEIYLTLTEPLNKLQNVRISYVKNMITYAAHATFLAIKPKKNCLEIEFLLSEEINDLPVYKTFRLSKSRIAHYVKLESPADINIRLRSWIHQAYETVNQKAL